MTETTATDENYAQALASLESTVAKLHRCSAAEKSRLQDDLAQLRGMMSEAHPGPR